MRHIERDDIRGPGTGPRQMTGVSLSVGRVYARFGSPDAVILVYGRHGLWSLFI